MVFWHIFCVFLASQGRIHQLEEDLNDERCSADRLMERLDKTKVQAGLILHCLCLFFLHTASFCVCWRSSISPSCEKTELCPVLSLNTQPYICFYHKQILGWALTFPFRHWKLLIGVFSLDVKQALFLFLNVHFVLKYDKTSLTSYIFLHLQCRHRSLISSVWL